MAADTLRQECDERTGEYRENRAGKDRDPLQPVSKGGFQVRRGSEGNSSGLPIQDRITVRPKRWTFRGFGRRAI
jgi:hypothetical protein